MISNSRSFGVSPVIGFILILGLVVVFLSWFQLVQAPSLNQEAESSQDDQVISSVLEYKSHKNSVIYDKNTDSESVVINNVVSYPLQPVQPPDGYGVVRFNTIKDPFNINNTDSSEITIDEPLKTSRLEYDTTYIELSNREYNQEYGLIVDTRSDKNTDIIRGSQQMLNGNKIKLTAIDSELYSIIVRNPEVTIYSDKKVTKTIEPSDIKDKNHPLEIEFKTELTVSEWRDILNPSESSYINSVEQHSGDYDLKIKLDQDKEYELVIGEGSVDAN